MKCQILFSGKNKKNINLLSAEIVRRVVKVKLIEHRADSPGQINVYVAYIGKAVCCIYREGSMSVCISLSIYCNV